VPDAVSAPLTTRRLGVSIAAAVLSLWLGFAVAAGVDNPAPSPPASAQQAAPTRIGLRTAPALRVRPALLVPAAATATATAPRAAMRAATPRPAPRPVSIAPRTPTSAPASPAVKPPAATRQPASAVQPARFSSPAPKPRPSPVAAPKKPSKPDFDESAPGGFDTSG
jgi:hypothetical protein